MPATGGEISYRLAYEVQPITLSGGIAGGVPGGVISVFSLLQAITIGGLTGTGDLGSLNNAFAHFFPIAGSSLIEYQIGSYPFANMTVAANAMIAQPLAVSMLMRVPCRAPGDYATKTYVMTALQNTLAQHQQSGGTYSVATPTFFYDNVLLVKLHDVSGGDSKQAQYEYQWDFVKPLVTLADAAGAQNAAMSLLSSGGATDGSLSGTTPSIGQPLSTATPSISPGAAGAVGAGTGTGAIDNGPGGGAGFGGGSGGSPFAGARA